MTRIFSVFCSEVGHFVKSASLDGLTTRSKVAVTGEGFIVWYIKDTKEMFCALKVPCIHSMFKFIFLALQLD